MGIREQEDLLFIRWKTKYGPRAFVFDGCPSPERYMQEARKVVFVLKDANLGAHWKEGEPFFQREQLATKPDMWWQGMACWCHLLRNSSASWAETLCNIRTQEDIKVALSRHCFIQLKKFPGVGSVENQLLVDAIRDDRPEILEQLGIYAPDIIICCGNADQVCTLFDCRWEARQMTNNGVGYWHIVLNGRQAILVDFCHPSNRAGAKVFGTIAKGLVAAIDEIAAVAV